MYEKYSIRHVNVRIIYSGFQTTMLWVIVLQFLLQILASHKDTYSKHRHINSGKSGNKICSKGDRENTHIPIIGEQWAR